ncbi:MAG: hypothetical protein KatS3mg027_0438 [Bacteroidia bacterium]|nr:MAG: hypothetical protein KatS3mg027_0438 [Bacteroidia bacterium]
MRKINSISRAFIFLLLTINVDAQNCQNNTHTDPTANLDPSNGGATPANNTFQQNTFDWRDNPFPYYIHSGNTLVYGPVYSPFYFPFWTPFSKGALSDFQPKNGWELIKQDLGFFYKNGSWNGGIMAQLPNEPGDPRGTPTLVPYFILYNKYTSKLRIIAHFPNITDKQVIMVKLSFVNSANSVGLNSSYTPHINALFNSYNKTMYALDKQTNITEIEVPCLVPYSSSGNCIMADFQMSYDPCVCFFSSAFYVSFHSYQTGYLSINGKYAGISSNINIVNALNVAGYDFSPEQFIASMFSNGNSPEAILLSYKDYLDMKNHSNNATINTTIDVLNGLIQAGAYFFPQYKDIAETVSKVFDFISSNFLSDNTPSPDITVNTGYFEGSGTLIYDINNYNGAAIRIGVPGALGSNTLPEYSSAQLSLPDYPTYNEPLGIFALLKTPKLEVYQEFCSHTNLSVDKARVSCRLKEPLVYKFHPIIDRNLSSVYVWVEEYGTSSAYYYNMPEVEIIGLIPTETSLLPQGGFEGVLAQSYAFPIHCADNLYYESRFQYTTYSGSVNCYPSPTATMLGVKRRLVIFMDLTTLPDEYGQRHRLYRMEKYFVEEERVTTDITNTSPGKDVINALQNSKSDLVLNSFTYAYSKPIIDTFSFGSMKIVGNQINPWNTSHDVNIAAEKEIDINGEVDILTAGSNIDLKIQSLPSYFDFCNNDRPDFLISDSDLQTYCTGGVYQNTTYMANQYGNNNRFTNNKQRNSDSLQRETILTQKMNDKMNNNLKKSEIISIYPNPNNSEKLYISISSEKANEYSIIIRDLVNKEIMNIKNFRANTINIVDVAHLTNGVYFIQIETEAGVHTEKLIIHR